jgi:histidine triad (HIT) family protein
MTCLFCSIAEKKIPATIVFEDEEIVAFHDINPQTPTHILIIPKKHIATIDEAQPIDGPLLGRMVLVAQQIARDQGFNHDGYRLVFNVNPGGGQVVYHIHLHLLGGRQMMWPPG